MPLVHRGDVPSVPARSACWPRSHRWRPGDALAWPEHRLHPIPDALEDGAAVLLEPLCIAFHALALGKVVRGSHVAVIGCGPIGLLLVGLSRNAGATSVIAVEPLPHRRAAAERAGATAVVESASEALAAGLVDEVGECEVTFEVAGTDLALADALALTSPGGKVIIVGFRETIEPPSRRRPLGEKGCR